MPPSAKCWKRPGTTFRSTNSSARWPIAVEGKIKIVQFWLMRAAGLPARELMDDVKAVKWLPLEAGRRDLEPSA